MILSTIFHVKLSTKMAFSLPVALSLLSLKMPLIAQSSCGVNLPVGLVARDGSLLNGLTVKDLDVHLHRKKLPIEKITYDTDPRRVLLILDTSRRLPVDVRKAEIALAQHVLSKSRPSDSFALITARGASRQIRFEQGNDAVRKAVDELAVDTKEDKKSGSLLDAIMDSSGWFGAPKTGDAILLMSDQLQHQSAGVPESSHSSFRTVVDTLARHGIRVFAMQFGPILLNSATYAPEDETIPGLAVGSGGYALVDSTEWYGGYTLTSTRIEGLRRQVFQLYGAIAQFYILELHAPMPLQHQQWKLDLAPDLRQNSRALYPQWFDPCSIRQQAAIMP